MRTHGHQGRGGRNHLLSLRWHRWWQLQRAETRGTTTTRASMIICGRAIGIYHHPLLHQSPPLHTPGLQCWQSRCCCPGGGGRNHRLCLRRHRWWQLRIAQTSRTTTMRVPKIICRLRPPTVWLIYGMEVKLKGLTKLPMMDIAKILHWMKLTILLKKDVHSRKNRMKAWSTKQGLSP